MNPLRPGINAGEARDSAGFTLIEMIVVVAIIGLAAGIVLPRVGIVADSTVKSSAMRLAGAFRHAFDTAAVRGEVIRLGLDLDSGAYWPEARDDRGEFVQVELPLLAGDSLPAGAKIVKVFTREAGNVDSGKAHVSFYPGGFAEKAVVEVVAPSGFGLKLDLNQINGKTDVTEFDYENS